MQTSEVLNKAGDHVQQYGHIKGTGHGPGDMRFAPACVIGAVRVVTLDLLHLDRDTAYAAGLDAMRRYMPRGVCIPDWSDAPERTADDVVAAFRAAALIEAARENAETREAVTTS